MFVEYSELVCRMGMFNRDRLIAITTKARDALAKPPRNCDVGTEEEQIERWQAFCDKYEEGCTGCPCDDRNTFCFAIWGQMPCEDKAGGL